MKFHFYSDSALRDAEDMLSSEGIPYEKEGFYRLIVTAPEGQEIAASCRGEEVFDD